MPHIRAFNSISVQGLTVPGESSVFLKPVKSSKNIRDGFLRVHNVSKTAQTLMPSTTAQNQYQEFEPEILGDDFHASMPMAWNNANFRFEIISMNNSLLPNGTRTLNNVEAFTQPGSTWTMQEIICAVQELPGSRPPGPKNPNNYMGYDRTNWQVHQQEVLQGSITGVDSIVLDEELTEEATITEGEIAYVVQVFEKRLAFVVAKSDGAIYEHQGDTLGTFLDSIGTAGCISLLQKAIRRRPVEMSHPEDVDNTFSSAEIVERIVRRMCCGKQAGFFLPLIGKFVTPLEHFLKRLFIIAAEDSEYTPEKMFFVSTKALLAAKIPHWRPNSALVDAFVQEALRLLHSSVTSHYETTLRRGLTMDFEADLPALVQKELGGMDGDQKMLRWLGSKPSDRNRIGAPNQPLSGCDPLDVYCDQHQEGRLVCFLENPRVLEPPNVFQKAEEKSFFAVSGYNTRRKSRRETPSRFQQMVFDGLRASSKARRGVIALPAEEAVGTKQWSVPVGALAGMIGTIEIVSSGARYLVTVSAHDLKQYVVIPNPTRDNKKHISDITPELRDRIILRAKKVFGRGRTASNVSDQIFAGATIRLQEDGWYVNGLPWEEARHVESTLVRAVDWDKLHAPRESHWPWTETFGVGQVFRPEVVQWCVGRMKGYNAVVIPKINRMGAGTDEAITGLEAEGFQFLMHLSEHYPDALTLTKAFTFTTKCMALRQEICTRLTSQQNYICHWPAWTSHLSLRPTQQQAFDEMSYAHQRGLASFLWMLVGQGKTLTVLSFLEATRSCRHVLWSLPKSAVNSVAEIIHEVGWKPTLLFPSRGLQRKYEAETVRKQLENPAYKIWASTTNAQLRNVVTLVEHDHLRKLVDKLASQMGQTAFVFDEVHKAMQSGTQRTAAALRLARLAKQLVALTGTPIVDKKAYGLMEWLRLCMPFPVSNTNFWVAANSMVTQLNSGEVKVVELLLDVKLTPEEKAFFIERFPARKPWCGKTQVPTRESWQCMRDKSNGICDRNMVAMAVDMYNKHPEDWRADHGNALQGNSFSQRPVIVAATQQHAVKIIEKLLVHVDPTELLLVGGARPSSLPTAVAHHKSIHLTEQKVMDGLVPPYKIVVAALRNCEGYSLTWMTCQITGSYPSNQASRTQMRGRINRLDAQRKVKKYWKVVAGMTSITSRYQEAAKLVEDALRAAPSRKKTKR